MTKIITLFTVLSLLLMMNCAEFLEGMAVGLNQIAAQDNLSYAASIGDLNGAKRALASGALINGRDSKGFTPLTIAAAYGQLHMVEMLVENGANPRLASMNGMTPIMAAQNYNQFHILNYFSGGGTTTSTPSAINSGNNSPADRSTNSLKSMHTNERDEQIRKEQEYAQKKIRIQQLKTQVQSLESRIKSDRERLAYYKGNWESNPSSSSANMTYRGLEESVSQLEIQKSTLEREIARLEAELYFLK